MANESDYAGVDSLGAYRHRKRDAPTARANVEIDYHTLIGRSESDPARADKTLKTPAPRRPSGQLR